MKLTIVHNLYSQFDQLHTQFGQFHAHLKALYLVQTNQWRMKGEMLVIT